MNISQIITCTALAGALGLVVPALAAKSPKDEKPALTDSAKLTGEKTQTTDDPCKWCTPCSPTPGSSCLKCCTSANRARAAVAELEKMLPDFKSSAASATSAISATPAREDKSIQKELDKEHKKARDGGYDKEFHRAIRDNGGERLKQAWKTNCNSRPAKQRELNCY